MPVLAKLIKLGNKDIYTLLRIGSSRRRRSPIDKVAFVMVLLELVLWMNCWRTHVDPFGISTIPLLQHLPVHRGLLLQGTLPQGVYDLDCSSYLGVAILRPEGTHLAIIQASVAKECRFVARCRLNTKRLERLSSILILDHAQVILWIALCLPVEVAQMYRAVLHGRWLMSCRRRHGSTGSTLS
jgi:hypothetical protein